MRPNTKAALATTLKLNGYSTAQFGKCHEVPPWQTSPVGPFDAWPSGGGGFEYFYGFIGGENNQYYPALYDGTVPVEPEKTPEEGYHLTEDLADRAIDWIRTQKALAPDKPFFVYFAPGATHAPHHVPLEWADKYAGQFADGWDAQREAIFERQKQRGVVPADAELTAAAGRRSRPGTRWTTRSSRCWSGRWRSTPGSSSTPTSTSAGSSTPSRTIGALENTLVYYIIGDNGASAEGTVNGAFNEMANFNGMAAIETPGVHGRGEGQARHGGRLQPLLGRLGVGDVHARTSGPSRSPRTGAAPATARSCTGPPASASKGEIRSQFCHVIDVAPTILEAAGLPEPDFVNGVQQAPIEGTSMVYSFDDADAPERHDLQYFEMAGNRGIYFKGWSAVTRHSTPWLPNEVLPALDDDVWELYDGNTDWTQAHDLAAEAAGAARGAATAVADRGGEVQRAADRRPPVRAAQRRPSPAGRS